MILKYSGRYVRLQYRLTKCPIFIKWKKMFSTLLIQHNAFDVCPFCARYYAPRAFGVNRTQDFKPSASECVRVKYEMRVGQRVCHNHILLRTEIVFFAAALAFCLQLLQLLANPVFSPDFSTELVAMVGMR